MQNINRFTAVCSAVMIFVVGIIGQSTGGVKGKVRTASGSGIADATVSARQNGNEIKSAKSDTKGNFVLDGLQPGKYNILFDAAGYSSGVLYNVEIRNKKVADLGERLILTRDPGQQIMVRGSVFFKEGFAVTGAKVQVERVNSDGTTTKLGSIFTNVSGEFTFRPDRPSKLRVTASYKGVSGSKDIDVDEPAIYRLAISLDLSAADK